MHEQGTIIATSDGDNITWNCEPSDTWQAGEYTPITEDSVLQNNDELSSISEELTYVLNTNSKKFL